MLPIASSLLRVCNTSLSVGARFVFGQKGHLETATKTGFVVAKIYATIASEKGKRDENIDLINRVESLKDYDNVVDAVSHNLVLLEYFLD